MRNRAGADPTRRVRNRPPERFRQRRLIDDPPEFLVRFQNEAASTGRIHDPNVVTIYESAQADDGTPYIAMEFLEGESLRQALTRRGQLPVPEVAEILQQAARGLNAAHKLGIIHRDLKPDNIFLTYSEEESSASSSADLFSRSAALGYDRPEKPQTLANRSALPRSPANVLVKLVDFGIAKLRESATHTQTGMVLGTPPYMSFEQASGMRSDELDARSDVYSLGVVVYEMLTGSTPFHSDTPVGYLRMHMQEDPPPFRAAKPDRPALPEVEKVVMRALAKDRNQRYGSVLEFAQEFTQAAKAGSHLAAQPEPQREAAKPQPQTAVTPVPKGLVPAAVRDTVAPKAVPETARPSRRKWLGSRWKGIGVVASVVWILGGGIYTLKVTHDETVRAAVFMKHACLDIHNGQETADYRCDKFYKDTVEERRPGDRIGAAFVAFFPVLLGWGFIYLVLFLVRRITRAATARPSRRKWLVVGSIVFLVVATAGVWYFSHHRLKVEIRVNPTDGLKYVLIPPGSFQMGCSPGDGECEDDEKPRHKVTITEGFWLGQTEVTAGAYKRFAAATGRKMPPEVDEHGQRVNSGWGDDAMPIVNVTWHDARAYCRWAGGRLPTEAEWEYAARGGSTRAHYGPIGEIAWYWDNSGSKPHDVGQKRANGFGLFDMLGNVWEWVNDWYDKDYYKDSPSQDPGGPASEGWPVLRGGAWMDDGSVTVRVSRRYSFPQDTIGDSDLGFRCVGDVFKASADMTGPTSESTEPAKESSKAKAPMVGPAPAQGNVSTSENIDLLSEFGAKEIGPGGVKVGLNPKDGLKYVWIPPGTFMMGCSPGDNECKDDEKPPHRVTITKGFWLGQTEVTVEAYKRFAGTTGRQMPHEVERPPWVVRRGHSVPIDWVTWDDAQAYCRWAGGRLPTEAEWEYAARGGSKAARYGDLDEIAWYADNSGRQRLDSARILKEDRADDEATSKEYARRLVENHNGKYAVGQKRANGFGLFDMLGNDWEWANDWYDPNYYQNSPSQDPSGPTSGTTMRSLRGGSWYDSPRTVRVSGRTWSYPNQVSDINGFRCAGEGLVP